ncbi:MAG: AmmeMemoRadiSam system radical SAM enzyme [Firmicutes bacterium]|nr:AmmeMemoRadiSam system radical SAM enzyme [Bacillota bacterium]
MPEHECLYYRPLPEGEVVCTLCPHACRLREGESGRCRGRSVKAGKLYAANYGRISALALDPIEKKPLYHFYPGTLILSVGTIGCNFTCRFCQNWQIAHQEVATDEMAPEELVALALRWQPEGNIGIAYTYSEPLVWFDYIMETARLAKDKGLKNVLVTNGYINPEPLATLIPYLDGVNLDLKGPEPFYQTYCGGSLAPVLKTAAQLAGRVHLEVTNLLLPGENDDEEDLTALVRFLASLDRRIPLHFSRYFPQYQMRIPTTPLASLEKAFYLAKEELHYVYLGNIPDSGAFSNTFCPECGSLWVKRSGPTVTVAPFQEGCCLGCGREVDLLL